MGRRPLMKPSMSGQMLGSQSPKVQEEIDAILLMFLAQVKVRLKDKIDNDAFKQLTLKELMSELRGLLKAVQKPATSLQQINIPSQPQAGHLESQPRAREIKNATLDPEKLAQMRERQAKYLENQGGDA